MASTQDLLNQVEQAISTRLAGDSYESYSEGGQHFRGTPLKDLYQLRKDLTEQLAAESGRSFTLAEPFYDE